MAVKGCWTCRERKVRCDSQWPRCGRCTKSGRDCKGYGIQLSWPRDGDKKRAMISQDAPHAMKPLQSQATRFLNSSSWDVSLSGHLENGQVPAHFIRSMKIPRPTYLSPAVLNREESHLLGFFNESRSLVLGPTDEEALAQFILRIAFSDSSDATNPVLQSVFALASLQLYGNGKSFQYKHLVVSSVKEPINWTDEKTLLQNLMALMLLYHYELSLESNSKGSWVTFFCAVKRVINTSPARYKLLQAEYSVLLDWIYYHEVLAEFTVRHWVVPYEGCGFIPVVRSPRATEGSGSKVEDAIGCPTDVLQLVVHTCRRAIVAKSPEMKYDDSEIERTNVLEQRITHAVGKYGAINIHEESAQPINNRHSMVATLHRIASLIYANRAFHCVSGTEFHHRRLVREGLLLLTNMRTCQNAWPLFIIACEAVDDEQRLAVLDVFEQSRQDRRRRSNHVHFIQHLVEAVWHQHDLNVENQVDYLTIFNAVIGSVPFMPLFA